MKHIENNDADARLWEAIIAHEGEVFTSGRGLEFSYSVKHTKDGRTYGEIVFDRKAKSITRATIFLAYQNALKVQAAKGCVKGPKKLGVFGASYLYPVFLKLGICNGPDNNIRETAEGMNPYLQNEIQEEHDMPRPKGSKNRKKAQAEKPLDALITEVKEAIAGLEEEKSAIEATIAENSAKLKAVKADLKKAAKKLEDYEAEQASKAAAEAAAAAKESLQAKIDELVSSGVRIEDILEKLK